MTTAGDRGPEAPALPRCPGAGETAARVRAGRESAVTACRAALQRIAGTESVIRAWCHLDGAAAEERAQAIDAAGPQGALAGVPVAVKDIIDTADMPTENGTPLDAGRRPETDATVVRRLREAGALVIDGLGGPIAERALLHLYNRIAERGGHLLLTAAGPPAHWLLTLPDLVSRLRLAPAAALGMPDDALLSALMVKLFADRQVAVAPEVPAYLVPRVERTFAAVASLVERLDRAALAEGRPVTVPLARAVLAADGERAATPDATPRA